jgi:hypothetical protein
MTLSPFDKEPSLSKQGSIDKAKAIALVSIVGTQEKTTMREHSSDRCKDRQAPLPTDSNYTLESAITLDTALQHHDRRDYIDVGTTFAFQDSLPRLPIPSLEVTLDKLKRHLCALQTEEQRELCSRIILDFLNDDGPKIQKLLIEYEKEGNDSGSFGSYVEEFWVSVHHCYLQLFFGDIKSCLLTSVLYF